MRKTKDDLDTVVRKMNSDASKAGGQDTTTRQKACDDTDADLATNRAERDTLSERLNNMNEDKTRKERALTALRGHGDLDEINRRLDQLRTTGAGLEATRASTLTRMRKLLSADACSWAFLHKSLTQAISVLDELADRNIIPGTAVEVLTDRLDLGVCICGHDISSDSDHRRHVEQLRDEQRQVSEQSAQLTALFHRARADQAETEARRERADGFSDLRQALLSEFTSNRDLLAQTTRDIVLEEERRAAIDEPRVQALTAALQALDKKTAELSEEFGAVKSRILVLEERREEQGRQLEAAEKATKISSNLLLRRDVARDLLSLAANTLDTLEHDYVLRVSDRMNGLFMQIVGSDPNFEAGVFTGVHIDDRCNIVVDTHGGRSLDTDFELNGASQRALTLAFIWALMEVSGTTAPRTIDTPLGMVSTGVKYRMVDAITSPAMASSPDFQVVLLLTRSEIRDVEDLLDERAGLVRTLSCSKDYPKDLTHPWGADHPLVRVCTCTHRQSCLICARVYDEQYGIDFRNEEASV